MRSPILYRSRGAAGFGSAILAASLCLMFSLSGFAQDPFQSAPAPAPLVRPAPAGWVSGKLVHWQGLSLGVQFVSDGTITSATTMTGKVSGFGITCDWWATKN